MAIHLISIIDSLKMAVCQKGLGLYKNIFWDNIFNLYEDILSSSTTSNTMRILSLQNLHHHHPLADGKVVNRPTDWLT